MVLEDRTRAGALALCAAALVLTLALPARCGADDASPAPAELQPAGAATLPPGKAPGLARFASGLSLREQFDLGVGRSFFRDPWVEAPATTNVRDGLGPLYEAHSCAACHPDGGPARVADAGGDPNEMRGLVLRLAIPGHDAARRVIPDPVYGDQLQRRGVAPRSENRPQGTNPPTPIGEGTPAVTWEKIPGSHSDGSAFELRRPVWRVDGPSYGPLDPRTIVAARRAPSVIGAGLIDAVPEEAILARADPDDANGDGISGRAARVPDVARGAEAIGRFGWKAAQPTLRQQVAAAFRDDVGITSALFREQPCSAAQTACAAAPSGTDPKSGVEIDAQLLGAVTDFAAGLGVPARPASADPRVATGHDLFAELGCTACHVPSLTTGPSARFGALRGQLIWPYSDLLLHDLGPGLADGQSEFGAADGEWRTAPLWGVGRAARAGGALLHDGRARTLEEAILWHGGEAQAARDRFATSPRERRDALIAFLETL